MFDSVLRVSAEEFDVNVRTIQRDLNDRLTYIPILKEKGYYFMDS